MLFRSPAPPAIRLQGEIAAVLRAEQVSARYAALGIEPVGNASGQFAEQIRADLARWEKVVKTANIRLE